jgi:holliday junction DNA helicase RuvA
MIALLYGTVVALAEDSLVVDTGGVGYKAFCSRPTLSALSVGGTCRLLVETHVREDAFQLFGFREEDERRLFLLLNTVQGVGGKAALSILSVLEPATLEQAIAAGDKTTLTRAPGVGAKLALRLLTELKDKVGFSLSAPLPAGGGKAGAATPSSAIQTAAGDAVSALVNLGYARLDAFQAVRQAQEEGGESVETLVKEGLKRLARAG